ncbi:MAG: hypothetical protein ACXQS3_04505 [Candidatus Methanofastidiosia archaeon]
MPDPYYNDRTQKKQREYSFGDLKIAFVRIIDSCIENNYFLEVLGYRCVDGNDYSGLWGCYGEFEKINNYIKIETGLENVWPLSDTIDALSEEEIFTLIEFFYDHISCPDNLRYHSWNNCGYHMSDLTTFDKSIAQEHYRNELNKLLSRYKNHQLDENGWIINGEIEHIDIILDDTKTTITFDEKIDRAIKLFLHHNSTIDDKKDALRELADQLEFLKSKDIKLPKKDGSDLFQIINTFDIRHKNKNQKGDYQKEIYYEWMFCTFLASINLLKKMGRDGISSL